LSSPLQNTHVETRFPVLLSHGLCLSANTTKTDFTASAFQNHIIMFNRSLEEIVKICSFQDQCNIVQGRI